MTTAHAQRVKETAAIARDLRKAGMQAQGYQRPFTGDEIFIASIAERPERVRVWKGDAEVNVAPDKTHHQAVMTIEESKRTIHETVHGNISMFDAGQPSDAMIEQFVRRHARTRSRVIVPSNAIGVRRTMTSYHADPFPENSYSVVGGSRRDERRYSYRAKLSIVIPDTKQSLLMGIDETAHFICALPENAATVEEAHWMLRPDKVPEGSPRQGEWFFVPAPAAVVKAMEADIARGFPPSYRQLETGSDHHAPTSKRWGGKLYVRGYIVDTRTKRHAPLHLDTWHEVIRNREVPVPEPQRNGRSLNWD